MLTNTTQTVLPNDLTFALFAPSLKTTITDICHLLVRVRDVLGLQFVVMVRLGVRLWLHFRVADLTPGHSAFR